jgi:hypothetical protein
VSARAAKPTPGLVLGAEPRANLLPPEVHERVKARRTRGYLVLLVIVVFLATAGGFAFASIRALSAQSSLAAAQTRTLELIEEKATYSEVIATTSALALITDTQVDATSTEITWGEVFDRIGLVLPVGKYFVASIDASFPAPWEPPLLESGPLQEARAGVLTLQLVTETFPEGAALYRSISEVEGIADVRLETVELPEGQSGYRTTILIALSADSLSDRWSDEDEEGADDEGE